MNLPLCRALTDENGQVYDIIAGTFFICGLSEDNFAGLTDEQARIYLEKFRDVEMFVPKNEGGFMEFFKKQVESRLFDLLLNGEKEGEGNDF